MFDDKKHAAEDCPDLIALHATPEVSIELIAGDGTPFGYYDEDDEGDLGAG